MAIERPFYALGDCLRVTSSGTPSAPALIPTESGPKFASATIRVFNGSPSMGFFKTGSSTVEADTESTFVAPGSTEIFVLPRGHNYISTILEAGAGYIYIQRGGGT